MGNMENYERDFEEPLLNETSGYYQRKAAMWIEQDSCPDYMLKSEEAIRLEEERVETYLHASTKVRRTERCFACLFVGCCLAQPCAPNRMGNRTAPVCCPWSSCLIVLILM